MKTSFVSRFLPPAVWLLAAFSALTQSWGAVSQLGTQSSQYTNSNTLAYTVNAGTDRLLVVALGDPNTATNPTAVTYNGTPMLQANATADLGFSNDAIWYLKLGTGGAISSNIVVTFAAGGNAGSSRFIGASAYSGVDQTTPVDINGPKISGSVTTTGSSLNVTSQAGDLVFDLFDSYLTGSQTSVTTGASQTLINDAGGAITPSGGFGHYTTSTQAGASTVAMSWTSNAGAVLHLTMNINATAPPPTAPTVSWPSTVTDTNYGSPRAIGKTNSGDVIMVTRVTGGGSTGNLRVTRHAGGTGLVSWTRDINNGNPDDASEMIVDPANGDAYIAARATPTSPNSNWFVYKVNGADGTVAWTYTFDGTAAANDTLNGIARTSDGNIVVCGDTLSAPSSINYGRVVKLNAGSGTVIWTYLETTQFTTFNAIATDASGNTYVTGLNTLNTDGYTVKINSGGTQAWAQPFVGTFGGSDSFNNIVVDSNGDCIIGGTTAVATSNTDAIIMKLAASNGGEVWRRVIGGTANQNESITNLIVDGSTFYACGFMRVTAGNRSGFVTRVNSDGTNPWIHTKDGSAVNGSDQYKNLRFFNGSIYAVGDATNTNLDVIVSRLNPNTGGQQWSITYDGPTSGADTPSGLKQVMAMLDDDTLAVGIEAFNTTTSLPNGILVKFAPGSTSTAPTVTTATQSAVTTNSATLGGNVTADGGASVTERGIVWKTSTGPTTADNKVANGSGTGTFSATVSSLPAGTTVFVRAYAINSVNTSYGSEISFTTLPPPTTVTSLNRVNAATTNLATVNWTLTFAAANTGVTASNFSLSGAAATGASVGSPTTSNGGLTWNVPITTGSTDGTLTLSLANATGTTPGVSTTLPFTTAGQSYTIDKTLPTVVSIVRQTPTSQATTSTSAIFRVTFSEAVNAPASSNFAIAAVSSSITGSIATVTAVNASTYDVTVTITSGSGEFRLKVID